MEKVSGHCPGRPLTDAHHSFGSIFRQWLSGSFFSRSLLVASSSTLLASLAYLGIDLYSAVSSCTSLFFCCWWCNHVGMLFLMHVFHSRALNTRAGSSYSGAWSTGNSHFPDHTHLQWFLHFSTLVAVVALLASHSFTVVMLW